MAAVAAAAAAGAVVAVAAAVADVEVAAEVAVEVEALEAVSKRESHVNSSPSMDGVSCLARVWGSGSFSFWRSKKERGN